LDKKAAMIPEFEYIEWFGALPVMLGMMLWAWIIRKKRELRLAKIFSKENFLRVWPSAQEQTAALKFGFLLIAILFLIIALANPRIKGQAIEVEHKGTDIIIALDISQSMMVRDVAPNRLSRAIRFGTDLIDRLQGERFGLVFFAGSAFTQMPLTQDLRVAKLFLQNADPSMVTNQGTSIGDAIELASSLFDESPGRGKTIVLISDGEDHDKSTFNTVALLQNNGIYLITIGVGTLQGGTIPTRYLGQESIMRNEANEPVISEFNPAYLNRLASEASGQFFTINDAEQTTQQIKSLVDQMEKGTLFLQTMIDYKSLFQYPLLLSLLFYFLYMIWPLKSSKL
jgi:Ca-activated chloride channel family protein